MFSSIRSRLVLLVLLGAIPSLILALHASLSFYQAARKQAQQETLQVKIYLPRVAEAAEYHQAAGQRINLPKGTELILLVEEEPNVRKISSTVLRGLGYDDVEATCGQEALRLVQQGKVTAMDLLVTDVIMPEMNGKELADQVLLSHPETKVLFISGYTADAIDQHGISDENLNLLQKPFTASVLAAKVREVLDGHAAPVLQH